MSQNISSASYLIHIWMVAELKLSYSALLLYALIYSYTVWSPDHNYHGSIATLTRYTGCCRHTVMTALKRLVEDGLLLRREVRRGRVTYVTYTALLGARGLPIEQGAAYGPNNNLLGPGPGPNIDNPSGPDAGPDDGGGTAGARPAVARVMESGEVEHYV